MAEFIVVGFAGNQTATSVLQELQSSGDMDVNIEASAIVSRNLNGECSITTPSKSGDDQSASTIVGSLSGGTVGLLVGAMLGNPALGLITGGAIGGVAGSQAGDLDEIGLDNQFNQEVGQALEQDSSAICFLMWDQKWDELPGHGAEKIRSAGGKIIRTTLSVADENELKSRLQGQEGLSEWPRLHRTENN